MKKRRMLLVEDDPEQRDDRKKALGARGWLVDTAVNGVEALGKLRAGAPTYDVVVLDLRMPDMSGQEVLEHIQDEQLTVPPIIAFSAYLDDVERQKCRYLGAAWVIDKPYSAEDLSELAGTVAEHIKLIEKLEFNEGLLSYAVKRREEALQQRLTVKCERGRRFRTTSEPLLVVARRWNSWYPSIFPVIGGAYAVVGVGGGGGATAPPLALIDPGFQFTRSLAELGLPWQDLDTCVISHNHPDHMGGIFELMAARYALGKRTKVLCSAGCSDMLGDCSGFGFETKKLDGDLAELIPPYESQSGWRRVRVAGFDTAHEEIGRQNSSQGLSLSFETGRSKASFESTATAIILGDTEYDRAQHKARLISTLCEPNVRVAVLHIGSCQLKQGSQKHLYLPGLKKILSDMEAHLDAIKYHGTLLALISEWGLEHATADQIRGVCGSSMPGFNGFSLMTEAVKYLQKGLEKIRLLPADIGLTVGVESGHVYLADGSDVPPGEVDPRITGEGLTYERRAAGSS